MQPKPNFVIVDPNILGLGGHYLEYAKMVGVHAQRRGYMITLVVNKDFQGKLPPEWTVCREFSFGYWGNIVSRQRSTDTVTDIDRRFLRLNYSRYGLLWAAASDLYEFTHYNSQFPISRENTKLLGILREIRPVADLIFSNIALNSGLNANRVERWSSDVREHYFEGYLKSIRAAVDILKHKSPSERAFVASSARLSLSSMALKRDDASMESLLHQNTARNDFVDVLNRVFPALQLCADSIILYPTINWFQVAGLGNFLNRNKLGHVPSHHIILRRNVYEGYPEEFANQEWQVHPYRTALSLFNEIDSARVRFLTDTDILTHQYNLLGAAKFLTGPVPVEMEKEELHNDKIAPVRDGSLIMIFKEVSDVSSASAFLDELEALTCGRSERYTIKLVVRTGVPLGDYIFGGLAGIRNFGRIEIILPTEISTTALIGHGVVGFSDWAEDYAPIVTVAIDRGIPILVPPSSWIAQAMCDLSEKFHRDTFRNAERVAVTSVQEIQWLCYDWTTETSSSIATPGILYACKGQATTADVAVPSGANFVRITFALNDQKFRANPINLILFFLENDGYEEKIGRYDFSLMSPNSRTASLALPVPEDVNIMSISACNFASDNKIPFELSSIDWFYSGQHVPALPGGLTYSGLVGDMENAWINPLTTLLMHGPSYGSSASDILNYKQLCRQVRPGARPFIATYVGDARSEKGFNHMPSLLTSLLADPAATDINLKIQIHFSSTYPEPECLAAAAILRSAPSTRIMLIDGALNSNEYANTILSSDAILVPYNRANYTARSSGIYSEALVSGVPAVIPAGTWMSAEADAMAYDEHMRLIEPTRIIDWSRPSIGQMISGVHIASNEAPEPQFVAISRRGVSFIHNAIPDSAGYVWITYKHKNSEVKSFTRFDISFLDAMHGGHEVEKRVRLAGGGLASKYSVLVRIPRRAVSVWIGMYNGFGNESYELCDFDFVFVASSGNDLPEFVGGVQYFVDEVVSDYGQQLSDAVRVLRRNYDVYLASAEFNRSIWATRCSPAKLIDLLEMPFTVAEPNNHSRFSASDW